MRIDKYIAASTDLSRKEVKKLMKQGAVTVDGEVCDDSGEQIDENTAVVAINGERVYYMRAVYLMLNKPAGYVSAVRDAHYKPVTDLVPQEYAHMDVYPAGRLDIDTEGLLILTNDGHFAHVLTSPNKNVYKRYFARLSRPMEENDVEAFAAGMEFKEFTSKPARLEITENPNEVYIEIAEGKFHQVKRMCEKVGKSVEYLKRVAIGSVTLDESLALGEVRPLTVGEIASLLGE